MSATSKVKAFLAGARRRARFLWRRRQVSWRAFARRSPWLARATAALFLLFALIILSFLGLFLWVSTTAPTVAELRQVQTQAASDIYSADSVLIGRFFNEYRTVVRYEDIAPEVVYALISTEDERFFRHRGVDYRAWGRVLVRSILRGDESGGGGSTLSQQLAKNLFPRRDYRFFPLLLNKLREIATGIRLEKAYSKEELLTRYLNVVPFPDNVYGIDVASRRFFSKSPGELRVEEAATLIGTLRATTLYHPVRHAERAQQRRNVVLGQMRKNGYLQAETYDSVRALPLVLQYDPVARNEGLAPYFRAHIRQELERILPAYRKANGEPYNLLTDGLKVYTTLHAGLQRAAEEAVAEQLSLLQRLFDEHWQGRTAPWGDVETMRRLMRLSPRYQQMERRGLNAGEIETAFQEKTTMNIFTWEGPKEVVMSPWDSLRHHLGLLQVGFIAAEPHTGFIRAWVGGINYEYFQYDHVRARRQAGSVFKPVVYAQALRQGIEPCEQIPNRLLVYHEYAKGDWAIKDPRRDDPEPNFAPDGRDLDDWIPQNSDGIYGGSYSMEGALTNSVNTVTVALIMSAGVNPVIDMARRLGIVSALPPEPSIALGAGEVSLLEMIGPFLVLASRGRQVRPLSITRIETADGRLLARFDQKPPLRALGEEESDIMTRMLQSVAIYGTASRLRWRYGLYNLPIAGKTGTSQNHADGWFIGYTPKLVAGVWVGGDSPLVRFRNFEYGQGAATALPAWAFFFQRVLRDPSLAPWQGGVFPELTPAQQRRLACEFRIPPPEELLADSLLIDSLLPIDRLPPLEPLPFLSPARDTLRQ